MKKFLFLAACFFFFLPVFSQQLLVQAGEKGLYVIHTVTPKENFYSLGRTYNVPPKDIAAFNNLNMEAGLSIGQTLNIPLTGVNFTQSDSEGQPVFYQVGESEGLYRVSVKNNKVLMANLRKWNDLKSDNISAGQKLVVGFLVSPGFITTQTPAKTEEKEPRDYARMPEENRDVVQKTEKPVEKKIEKPVEQKPATQSQTTSFDGSGGYFKTSFDQQVKVSPITKDAVVTAGIFKTASGWQDAKYYALIDGVEPGTIIRVVNTNNNKAVYAKVLDKMSGIRQNAGYDLRISNAAATALDINETDKFFVRVNY